MGQKTDFDRYLEEQLRDKAFAERFRKAGKGWDGVMRRSDALKTGSWEKGIRKLWQMTRP